ncbi:DUF58 domain-containing protein [Mucilaginibacter arboris]|uniref:DUF58 domain-containing protein n=1 Tax=Mucilaginibacter arboris TaxID=2682090 RepID=A0A7K1SVD5_9SPHI|nr:DUF58 domain-containing protein [Mucilaginibacter arboris]MVN21198.1 DUF58 domain-containing protein [Mucilaginibacter arboris]
MKNIYSNFYYNLFLGNRLFFGLAVAVILFLLSFFFSWMGDIPLFFFWALMLLLVIDLFLLYRTENGLFARRNAPERLSNGDENELGIYVENFYSFPVSLGLIDEIPFQFQKRDVWFKTELKSREHKMINYQLRPTKRGEYEFGDIHAYVQSPIALISRRYTFAQAEILPVYPSFLQMQKYELLAVSNRLTEQGIKKIRRIGHSMEFEQIKNYVPGDDYRTINWKATARKGDTMVNAFTDEKSQHVYCIIDKSRAMKMPFEGLSLLDYAINASLALLNIAMLKEDRAGLITISEKTGAVIPADRRSGQLNKILQVLHKEKTRYLETNMEALYTTVRTVVKQRSLIVFFTNFESLSAMERQLPYLRKIARLHLLLVVFFKNTELEKITEKPATDVEEVYIKTVAEKFLYEKRLVVKELNQYGIQSILCNPLEVTVDSVNKYLEIKARQQI